MCLSHIVEGEEERDAALEEVEAGVEFACLTSHKLTALEEACIGKAAHGVDGCVARSGTGPELCKDSCEDGQSDRLDKLAFSYPMVVFDAAEQ